MTKQFATLCAIAFLASCSSSPKIVLTTPNQPDLRPLRGYARRAHQLVVIFVHGVGDHCPGYALEGDRAWINGKAFRALGLKGRRGPVRTLITPVTLLPHGAVWVGSDFVGEGASLGDVETQAEHIGNLGNVPVTGVEITWSELTYGVKLQNLDFDLTRKGRSDAKKTLTKSWMQCFNNPKYRNDKEAADAGTPPLARAWLNRKVKEKVLDQELSDAILYLGPYGEVIQRAVALGICDAIRFSAEPALGSSKGEADGNAPVCWADALRVLTNTTQRTEYVIVTHSLGSRIVYDIVRNLDQINAYHDSPFNSGRDHTAFIAFPKFTCKLGAVYMMANQLPLLGLATGGTLADVFANDRLMQSLQFAMSIQQPFVPPVPPKPLCRPSQRTQFVGFVDTNDLLSWAIRPTMDPTYFDFTTVYVDNSWWHTFGLYESPTTAHDGYFDDRAVGAFIACGDRAGVERKCCPQ